MDVIKAIYYNGKSSKKYEVELELYEDGIQICAFDDNIIVDPFWKISKIENVDFTSSKTLNLKYGIFPFQSLIVKGDREIDILKEHFSDYSFFDVHQKVLKWDPTKVIISSILTLAALISTYLLFVAPFIAEQVVNMVPISAEIRLGERLSEPVLELMDIDEEKSLLLQEFYESLGYESNYPIKLLYESSDQINAFAIPGGIIVVHEGLLNKMDHWEELAGLVGHELAHVENQHSLKTLSRSLSTYLVISVFTSDVSGLFSVFVDNAFRIQEMSNSRSFETEADEEGLRMMINNDIDPFGITDLFDILKNAEGELSIFENESELDSEQNENKLDKYLRVMSSHPLTEDRIDHITTLIEDYPDRKYKSNVKAKEIFEKLLKASESEENVEILAPAEIQED